MLSAITFILMISFLIVAHEFGHYLAARKSGVKVEKFAIGFGPAVFTIKGKETNFSICVFPLGGYVKMAGDTREEKTGRSDEFLSKPAGVKALIVFAGPFFNYIFAFILFWVIAFVGMDYNHIDPVIGGVTPDYPAQEAGIQKGDKILAVNGRSVKEWTELQDIVRKSKNKVSLKIDRQGSQFVKEVSLKDGEDTDLLGKPKTVKMIGAHPYQNTKIGYVADDYPAKKAGLKEGDEILSVNGIAVDQWREMTEIIWDSKDKVSLEVNRQGEVFSLDVAVKEEEVKDKDSKVVKRSFIGIVPTDDIRTKKYNIFEAFLVGAKQLFELTSLIVVGFVALFTGALPFKDAVAGPLGIYGYTSVAVKAGIVAVLHLMAALNISLAIINLFPFPILDGGHLMIFLVEKIRRKQLELKIEETLNRIGLVVLGLFFAFVLFNDVRKIVERVIDKQAQTIESAQEN
ncbi:MAG: RIP metalloprotease RseP [Candidatus Omnitrophica bacterium]|nr:RIP metalloprotease RseP [Candidatus Omnitrophota bacterium]